MRTTIRNFYIICMATYCYGLPTGASQRVDASCSRALEAGHSIRQRLGSAAERANNTVAEQRSNFALYTQPKKSATGSKEQIWSGSKGHNWSVKMVCLSEKNATRVPCSVAERKMLVQAGLGEKVIIPDITCSAQEFQGIIISAFPKLDGCSGFDLLRCIPNTKELEMISLAVSQSPKLLKSVVGCGKVFIWPIQQNLDLDLYL